MFGKDNHNKRNMVFIDLENVQKSVSLRNPYLRMDYSMFGEYLNDRFSPEAAYVFDSRESESTNDHQNRFHNALSYMGYRVKLWKCGIGHDGERYQKCVDTGMVCEILKHLYKDHADHFIIVSGDRDFVPVIDSIRDEGKSITVICDREYGSRDLMKEADEVVDLCTDLPDMMTICYQDIQQENVDLAICTEEAQEVE